MRENGVETYIAEVQSGKRTTGKLERLAVERYLADLQEGADRFLYFDEAIASEAISFFPLVCRHSVGEWNGQAFYLSGWQEFIIWNVFGWRRKSDGTRRFRKVYISVARKNGKSTFVAALGLLLFCFDNPQEPAAEIYVAATKEAQATIIHREATRMRDKSPSLRKLIKTNKNRLYMESNSSFFVPIGSDSTTTDGLNPHGVLKDELHAWQERHRGLHEKLSTGGASRRQPLEVIITTAGDDKSEIWIEEDAYASKVLESAEGGPIVSDNLFAFIATIDPKDDPFDEANWPKANPNLGVSVKLEYLREQAAEAKGKPTARNAFTRYHTNRRVSSTEKAIDPEAWRLCGSLPQVIAGAEGFGAFDLGRTDDFGAIACVFPYAGEPGSDGEPTKCYDVEAWTFTSREAVANMQPAPFFGWQDESRLSVNEGATMAFAAVRDKTVELAKLYQILSWAYDPTFAQQMAQELDNDFGLPMFDFFQSPKKYTEPIKAFQRALLEGRIRHGGEPLLGWQFGNLTIRKNYKDEWMPDKGATRKSKIDAAVATLMAFSEALFHERTPVVEYDIISI